jgi:broad specificity phosphatase PhoE
MLILFYSPHATGVDNEAGLASGHADVPLSATGRREAEALGRRYAAETPAAVYCSDLERALATAKLAFAGRGLSIVADGRLRECDYGDLTRCPAARIDAERPQRIVEPFPHGESLRGAVERVGACLRDLLRKHDGQTIVIIGHRATRYGLAYWTAAATLEERVRGFWERCEAPVSRYRLTALALARRLARP